MGGTRGNTQDFGGLFDRESGKKPLLHQLGLARVEGRQLLERLVDRQHLGRVVVKHGRLDSAATAAFWAKSGLSASSRGTTIGFSLSFLSAGRAVDLVAEARVRRRGKEICNGEVVVRNPSGGEVAQAIVTYKLSS